MSRGNLAALLDGPARWNASEPALVLGSGCVRTWAELEVAVATRAGGLRTRHGIVPGTRVGLFAANCPEYLEMLYAVWQAGAVVVPISSRLHPREAAALLAAAGATACLTTSDLAHDLAAHAGGVELIVVGTREEQDLLASAPLPPTPRELTDDAWIFFTSGTTGTPKGARLSHGNLLAMAAAYHADVDSINPGDSLVHVAALSHASGLFSLPFVARGATQVIPASGGFDAEELLGLLARARRASFFLPPTLVRRLARTPGADVVGERIGTLIVGAAPVRAEDLREGVATFGPRLWNGYGQGESPCTITAMSRAAIAAALAGEDPGVAESVGVARWATRVRTVGPDGAELPAGEVGEVVVAGPTVMSGYLDLPEASADTLRDGWLHTGDLGRFDGAGRLTLVDRMKDMLISGGYNVYPREIEDVLLGDPAVAEAAVIGVPDAEWGERVIAFVVGARAPVDTAALDARCLAEIARYKRPREYHVVAELPRNSAGKVLKRELRERVGTGAGTS